VQERSVDAGMRLDRFGVIAGSMKCFACLWALAALSGAAGCVDAQADASGVAEPARAPASAERPQVPLDAAPPVKAEPSVQAEPPVEPEPVVEAEPVGPCPPEMVHIGRYCVDRWEAHLVTMVDGQAHPVTYTEPPAEDLEVVARSSPGRWPQPYISRVRAAQACAAAGKRLCSRREWTRACMGKSGSRFSYGHREQKGACNVRKEHLMPKFFGRDNRLWKYDEQFNSSLLAIVPGFLEGTGERDGCVSDEGVHDMVGNLHEWVSGMVDEELVEGIEAQDVPRQDQPWTEGNGIFMGGFFSTALEHGPGCSFITYAHEPAYHDYSTGFRCCAEPEQAAPTSP